MNHQRGDLVKYRYEKAQETFKAAEKLLAENLFHHAVNRYYYTVFYAIQALLATIKSESRKHSGTIAIFNKEFVKTGLFDKKYSRIVKHLFDERSDADYQDFKVFQKSEVEDLRLDVADFLKAVGEYLLQEEWLDL